MVKESTVCVVDDTDYGRNEDYDGTPRIELQKDLVQLIMNSKLRGAAENDFGLVRTAGGTNNVTVGLTRDEHQMAIELNKIDLNTGLPKMTATFVRGIDTARLCLKNRSNRGNKCRIICFVGSIIREPVEEFIDLAKICRKEKMAVDVISFGAEEVPANADKLSSFVQTLNGKDGTESHLVTISYPGNFMNAFRNSPIMQGEDGQPLDGGVGDADPELQEILRQSLMNFHEEEQRRQAAAAGTGGQAATGGVVGAGMSAPPATGGNLEAMTEDEQLELALRLSMEQSGAAASAVHVEPMDTTPSVVQAASTSDGAGKSSGVATAADASSINAAELERLVATLPGADLNDPEIQKALKANTKAKSKTTGTKPSDGPPKPDGGSSV